MGACETLTVSRKEVPWDASQESLYGDHPGRQEI
jgi:hypothetical protein